MNKGLKKDVETLNDSFSQYQVMRKAIEKSGTLVFDVDIFETKVIDEMAELLIALHVLMLSMDSKKRVQNDMKLIARKHVEAVLREKDRRKGV